MPEVLGLDIGGANLKAATSAGRVAMIPFPLWKQPEKLTGGIIELLLRLPRPNLVGITMTGELCDCFPDKKSGVRHILEAVEKALPEQPLYIWRNDGKWASLKHAKDDPLPVASANWLASATYAGRFLPEGSGWFFDLGSTTLDMIPLQDGKPAPRGRTDLERLRAGELAYLGASRTPITSLVQYLDVEQETVTAAAELFATFDDVLLILEQTPEDGHDHNSADGKPRTRPHAEARIARMVCSDPDELGKTNIRSLCGQIMAAYRKKLASHLRFAHARHPGQLEHRWGGSVLAGSGAKLLTKEIDGFHHYQGQKRPVVSMADQIGPECSTALAAYAVAILLAERQAR